MRKALGFIEVSGVTAAMTALDIMCKTADVELVTWERKLGGRLVTLVVQGEVAAVRESIEAAAAQGLKKPVAQCVIANPHEETLKILALSAQRIGGLKENAADAGEAGKKTDTAKAQSKSKKQNNK